jgi:D-amino-acid dehydrogenase
MVSPAQGTSRPQRVAVVGAGMVGLSTAWFLQERGVQVTVLDRSGVAAGSSWGNAGWLTPSLTTPLPEPAVLRYGMRAVLSPTSPVYVPLSPRINLLRFLAGFARHSTHRRWGVAMRAYGPINVLALDAFDRLAEGGVQAPTREAEPFLACFASAEERATLVEELEAIQAAGQEVKFESIDGEEARAQEPALAEAVRAAVRLHGQRFINPPEFMEALATSVRERGGEIWTDVDVHQVRDELHGVTVVHSGTQVHRFDAVVLANGAALSRLARPVGVRQLVQAGRGYSFSVEADRIPGGPVYLPAQRVACTPLSSPSGDRLRVAGMMEFRSPESPLDHRRIEAVVAAARPFLKGVDLEDRHDEWVGSRPCTADGLPLVGGTSSRRVFVAGGHGMWGIALGPVTGRLLADRIVTGDQHPVMTPFDPLR